jgi:hypothetical protein
MWSQWLGHVPQNLVHSMEIQTQCGHQDLLTALIIRRPKAFAAQRGFALCNRRSTFRCVARLPQRGNLRREALTVTGSGAAYI